MLRRPGRRNGRRQLGNLTGNGHPAQPPPDIVRGCRIRQLQRRGNEHRAFPLPQIITGRLASHAGITKHPQLVVPQLKRHPNIRPIGPQRRNRRRIRPRQGRPQVQRPLNRIRRGLKPIHHLGGSNILITRGLMNNIQQLAPNHFGAHPPPRRLHPIQRRMAKPRSPHHVIRPGKR